MYLWWYRASQHLQAEWKASKWPLQLTVSLECPRMSVLEFVRSGWPEYSGNAPVNIRAYMKVKNELSEADGLLICGSRIVIPLSLRANILKKIHDGHQGLTKCKANSSNSPKKV